MRISVLWAGLANYSIAFFKELTHLGWQIQLIYQPTVSDAPYDPFDLSFCHEAFEDSNRIKAAIEELTIEFHPDCVLMTSWNFPHYMRAAKKLRGRGAYVVSVMDNQWRGTAKQWLGVLSARWFLKNTIDTFLVTGDRHAHFARKLGYDNVLYGYAAANIDEFNCSISLGNRDKNFLFIGRLKYIKGVDILVRAYLDYRDATPDPWGLIVVGTGELDKMLHGVPGLKLTGFIQPNEIPPLTRMARCLILPSRFEQWGVVIHEATAAGLPIIATYLCGATTSFVRDGVNGYLIGPKEHQITDAMLRMTLINSEELEVMGAASRTLASLWNPKRLAKYFSSTVRWRHDKSFS
jgi:glycosyltransferase involved in cell wall biosynthesis